MKKYLLTLSGLMLSIAPISAIVSCSKTTDTKKESDKDENEPEEVLDDSIRIWAQDENNITIIDKVFQFTEDQTTLQDLMLANQDYFRMGEETQYGRSIEQIKNTTTGNWISAIYGIDNAFWSLSSPTYDNDSRLSDSDFLSSKEIDDQTLVGASGLNLKHKDVFVLTKIETDSLKVKKEIEAIATEGKIATNIANAETKLPSEVIKSDDLPFSFTTTTEGATLDWDIKENGFNDQDGELTIVITVNGADNSQLTFDLTLTGFQKFAEAYSESSFVRIWARIRDNEDSLYLGTKLFDITFRVTEDITNVATWMKEQTNLFRMEASYLRGIYNSNTQEWVNEWSNSDWTNGEFWSLWSPTEQDSTSFPKKEYSASEFLTTDDKGTFSNDFIGSYDVDHTKVKGHIVGWIFAPTEWMWGTFPS